MIKDENYITILGFMVNKLDLKGNELLVYAIIFGFSQLKNQRFTGSLQYLADWTNSTKQGIQKNLKSLIEKGLIAKEDKIINNVKFVEYYATELYRVYNSVAGGIQHSCTNNIYIEEEKEEGKTDIKKTENPFEFYQNNFGLMSTYTAENINTYLLDGLSEELIVAAMKEAIDNNARKWNYVKTILNDCLKENITTVEQYKAKQIEFKNQKSNKTTTTKKQEVTYNTDFSEYDEYARRE